MDLSNPNLPEGSTQERQVGTFGHIDTSFGVLLSKPSWLPNFNVLVDYYKIKIEHVISTLSAADIVNYCFQGSLPQTCSAFNLNNQNGPNFINVQAFNFASIETSASTSARPG